jgi:SAM-dependent methyltransferase
MLKEAIRKFIPERIRLNLYYNFFRFRSLFYRGKKFYCVCCQKSFRKFLQHGNIPRKNAACPYCNSLERTRLLYFYLERETNIFEGKKKVLHFAPERMLEKKLKSTGSDYVSADINAAYADQVIDITSIPYPENTFDYIICSHVLGHVPNEKKAIDEMYRVLKPGGSAFILTVIDRKSESTYEDKNIRTPEEKLMHYGENDLVRLHGLDFEQRLKRSNMDIRKIDYRNTFTKSENIKYSLGDGNRELIFDCIKLKD